jgi:subfamily B ATP-binding cassette protein MsbA
MSATSNRPSIRRDAFADLRRLLRMVGKPAWATPVLIGLGLASSFAETIGISLILLFLYSMTGHVGEQGGGLIGTVYSHVAVWVGGTMRLSLLILVLIIARGALALLYDRISFDISEAISERARNMVHQQYLTAGYGFMRGHDQANLLEILSTETLIVAGAYSSVTRLIINGCSIGVFSLFLLAISWKIMAVALLSSVIISGVMRSFAGPGRVLGQRVQITREYLAEMMLITVHGLRTIRAYGAEEAHHRRFTRVSREARQVSTAQIRLSAWIGPVTEVAYLAVLCVIIAGTAWWHTNFAITLGAVALLYRLQPHTREFENHLLQIAQVQTRLRSVRDMLEPAGKDYPPEGHVAFTAMRSGVAFRDVSFRYGEAAAAALDCVSFDIPAGGTTALIGASGAGKTTIVNLLLRLYRPAGGAITVDDVMLDDLRRTDWLRQIAVAGQDVDLVEGTVEDNIRMADPFGPDEVFLTAAASAGVAEFIEPLPDRYQTWVGHGGMRFSGGQRQRIGLARALLRDAQLMILDEAMSALDRGLEDRIKQEIDRQLANRTLLIITHRLETIRNADHVIWIENGKIRAQGRPADILPEATMTLTTVLNSPSRVGVDP